MILCGHCYDDGKRAGRWSRMIGIQAKMVCEECRRDCQLGYIVRAPAESAHGKISPYGKTPTNKAET